MRSCQAQATYQTRPGRQEAPDEELRIDHRFPGSCGLCEHSMTASERRGVPPACWLNKKDQRRDAGPFPLAYINTSSDQEQERVFHQLLKGLEELRSSCSVDNAMVTRHC